MTDCDGSSDTEAELNKKNRKEKIHFRFCGVCVFI